MLMRRVICVSCCLLAGCPQPESASPDAGTPRVEPSSPLPEARGDGDAIEYTVRFPAPETHYVEVDAIVPTGGADPLEMRMAVWTPGSYLVREFARHLEAVRGRSLEGEPLDVEKVTKNRWHVTTGGADRVVVSYRVYAREMSVRTNFVDSSIAVLNGAPTFMTRADDAVVPHDVRFELPADWTDSVTSLPAHETGDHRYLAESFDQLVDSPVVLGTPALYEFEVAGAPHVLANFGEGGIWEGERSARDLARVVDAQTRFWGVVPYERYVFLNILEGGGGGLEHLASTLMMDSRWATRRREDYRGWLGLASHEFFHTWNVKRLRPHALGPFDYEKENYTRMLWVAEGVTSYYDDLFLQRAGLFDRDAYLERLSKQIEAVQTRPGRHVQSLADASFDAWIKYYRPDENSQNTDISYYQKGAVVAFLLDAEIRRASAGRASLDDVMRRAYGKYSGDEGYGPAEFRALVNDVAGTDLGPFFDAYVDGTDEIDYGPVLDFYGLRFLDAETPDENEEVPAWLGVETGSRGGRLVVTGVPRDTPAFEAGLNVEDEIIAIGDYRVPDNDLEGRLAYFRPDDEATLLIARRERLMRLPVKFGAAPRDRWRLEIRIDSTSVQRSRLDAWLRKDDAPEPPAIEVRTVAGGTRAATRSTTESGARGAGETADRSGANADVPDGDPDTAGTGAVGRDVTGPESDGTPATGAAMPAEPEGSSRMRVDDGTGTAAMGMEAGMTRGMAAGRETSAMGVP